MAEEHAPTPAPPISPAPPRPALTLADLCGDLVWPRLLRVPRLALRPARVGLGAFYLVGCSILLGIADRLDGDAKIDAVRRLGTGLAGDARVLVGALAGGRSAEATTAMVDLFIQAPARAFREAPWAAVFAGVTLLLWTALIGGAIARTAATELAWSRTISWPEALAIALRRWKSLAGAVLVPLGAVWGIALLMTLAGGALFRLPLLSVLGGLAWGAFLLGGLAAAVIMLGFLLSHAMLVPAVVCEGSDSIDAVQHTFALGFGRPLRLALYWLLLVVQGLLLLSLIALVALAAMRTAEVTAGALAGDRGAAVIASGGGAEFVAVSDRMSPPPPSQRGAAALVRGWSTVLQVIAFGAAVSYFWCAATGLFLVMRRVFDGQDVSELWSPGLVDGTTTPESSSRPGPRPPTGAGEAIIDNGPADEG